MQSTSRPQTPSDSSPQTPPPQQPGLAERGPLDLLAGEARALYLGREWHLFLRRLEELYRVATEEAVSWSLEDPPRALAYLHQAAAYRRPLHADFARQALAAAGVPLDKPTSEVASPYMKLDSEGRRNARKAQPDA